MNKSREAQARRGEEPEVDPEAFQDPDNETGLFAGTVYEADDEEADQIYEGVDNEMDKRRKARRLVHCYSPFPSVFKED
jgi:pre-mRNA-processing factor 6